jgi:uncharacterized membrane protein
MAHKVATLSLAAAVAGALSMTAGTTLLPTAAAAAVKCYGVAKAGKNDCANASGKHSCAGNSKVSYDGEDWKKVDSAAKCTEMGGKTTPFKGINKNVKAS